MEDNLIHVTNLKEIVFALKDEPWVYTFHDYLSKLLDSELSREASNFLAKPVENQKNNSILWYVSLGGDLKSFAQLGDKELGNLKSSLSSTAGEYAAFSKRLLASDDKDRRICGKLLALIAAGIAGFLSGRPGTETVFLAGGTPVLAGWGLIPSGLPKGTRLIWPEPIEIKEPEPPEPVPITEPSNDWQGGAAAPPTLISAGFTGPESPEYPNVTDLEPPGRVGEINYIRLPKKKRRASKVFLWISSIFLFLITILFISGTFFYDEVFKRSSRRAGGGLMIPKNAKMLEFLEGCWMSETGMVLSESNDPINYKYCFDKSGNAKVTIILFDQNKKWVDDCVGEGKATLLTGEVRIEDSGLLCENKNLRITPSVVSCGVGETEQEAGCDVVNSSGNRFPVNFSYLGVE